MKKKSLVKSSLLKKKKKTKTNKKGGSYGNFTAKSIAHYLGLFGLPNTDNTVPFSHNENIKELNNPHIIAIHNFYLSTFIQDQGFNPTCFIFAAIENILSAFLQHRISKNGIEKMFEELKITEMRDIILTHAYSKYGKSCGGYEQKIIAEFLDDLNPFFSHNTKCFNNQHHLTVNKLLSTSPCSILTNSGKFLDKITHINEYLIDNLKKIKGLCVTIKWDGGFHALPVDEIHFSNNNFELSVKNSHGSNVKRSNDDNLNIHQTSNLIIESSQLIRLNSLEFLNQPDDMLLWEMDAERVMQEWTGIYFYDKDKDYQNFKDCRPGGMTPSEYNLHLELIDISPEDPRLDESSETGDIYLIDKYKVFKNAYILTNPKLYKRLIKRELKTIKYNDSDEILSYLTDIHKTNYESRKHYIKLLLYEIGELSDLSKLRLFKRLWNYQIIESNEYLYLRQHSLNSEYVINEWISDCSEEWYIKNGFIN